MSRLLTNERDTVCPPRENDDGQAALRIVLRGRVQGLGVRPAVARLARELKLAGSVSNSTGGVLIHVEGAATDVARFWQMLRKRLPEGTRIESLVDQPVAPTGATAFCIESSTTAGPLAARVPPDVRVCDACLADVQARGNRRQGYVFTTCTECGPRYSLIEAMPYDRAATAMRHFASCAECEREYARPADRRFHSQTNACAACGPQVWFAGNDGHVVARTADAIEAAVRELRRGRILALRGVGGYQLVVDATSPQAVGDLRRRKGRFGKPLAVMVADLAAAERAAVLDEVERRSLAGPENPIVIVKANEQSPALAEVAGGLGTIGLMLPTTPLHDELTRRCGLPLVVTSGNVEGDPLAFAAGADCRELAGLADFWLDHDRPIVHPIDDSVLRVVAGRAATVRLARGFAPLPLEIETRPILALGGHQKAAIALSNGAQAVLGPHVGDLETEASRARYLEHVESMCRLYGFRLELLVCDLHPDYFSTRWAAEQTAPRMFVQHHHAHVAAGMLEAGWLDRDVLGVAWDGTGYGPDGTIWGGEFLISRATDFRRVASLRPFVLPGGERAVREPWRVAVSLICQAVGAEEAARLRFHSVAARQVEQVVQLASKPYAGPITSSAGRLFDGIAALALGITNSQFEGQPAMLLEAACETDASGQYALPVSESESAHVDWRPLVRGVLADLVKGTSPGSIAMRFHRALAAAIAAVSERHASLPVVLCGGCFQNKLLTELAVERLENRALATPGVIPTGDGGLAAGQLAVAAARLARGWQPCV